MIMRSNSVWLGFLLFVAASVSTAHADSLYAAASAGRVDEVRRLIAEGAEVDLMYRYDEPLHGAAAGGHAEVVALLLDAGANANGGGMLGTPLHAAAAGGNPAVIELLIARGAKSTPATRIKAHRCNSPPMPVISTRCARCSRPAPTSTAPTDPARP